MEPVNVSANPDLMQLIPYAAGGLILLLLLSRIPYVGAALRLLFSFGLLALAFVLITERASLDPMLSRLTSGLNLDRQEVVGNEVRIRMSPDGHFWANVRINGVKRRMMIDSGATVTALSERTAAEAGIEPQNDILPVVLRTANGMTQAQSATAEKVRLGDISATNLKVVVSPAFGDMDLLGMNFLSRLKSWRVEENMLILVPHHPRPEAGPSAS
jgi:aspartyl protease family protein